MAEIRNRNLIETQRLEAPAGESLEVVRCNLSAIRPLTPLVVEGDVRFVRCNLTNRLLVDGKGEPVADAKLDHCQISQILFEEAREDAETGEMTGTGVKATRRMRLARGHWVGKGVTGRVAVRRGEGTLDAATAVEAKAAALAITRAEVAEK